MSKKIEKELDFAEYEIDEDQKAAVKIANVEAKYEKAFDEFDKAAGRKKAVDAKVAAAQEKRFQAALAEKAAKDAAQKEIDNITENMSPDQKGRLLAALGVVATPVSGGKAKYDHETTKKNLVKNTAPVRALMETLKDDYEAVYYMGSLCDYWKSLMTLDRAQNNEHVAFIKYFRKERHLYGLPAYVKTGLGLADLTIDDSENEEAGAA